MPLNDTATDLETITKYLFTQTDMVSTVFTESFSIVSNSLTALGKSKI